VVINCLPFERIVLDPILIREIAPKVSEETIRFSSVARRVSGWRCGRHYDLVVRLLYFGSLAAILCPKFYTHLATRPLLTSRTWQRLLSASLCSHFGPCFSGASGISRAASMLSFGALSDRVGRKWRMMAACLISIVSSIPIYKQMQVTAGNNIVTVRSTTNKVTSAISLAPITTEATGPQAPAKKASNPNVPMLVSWSSFKLSLVCMIYGPIAAYLVETFPARIRYMSLSLPHHIGNGVFGGCCWSITLRAPVTFMPVCTIS
jgi:MFS family permease